VFNVASANMRFGEAAATAADWFGAQVVSDGKPDLCNYRIDATAARTAGLLDERINENLPSAVRSFVAAHYPAQLG
jgi:hypothetical protein